ncbi:MAG TPA: saccharopine dehydrogenase [Phaeodactylibacter sp.]|nr:saccharopine dehydrogenase [Phaeodactylibacter sp.]
MNKIVIVGAGGIGRAVGLILAENKEFETKIFIGDLYLKIAKEAANWIEEGIGESGVVTPFDMPAQGTNDAMTEVLKNADVLLDCLPGSQAPRMAKLCRKYDLHYANLTEYVKETNEVMEIAEGSDRGFILQTGLAPGFINVLGMKLYNDFCAAYGVTKIDKMSMKVGALTKHARAPHFYGFTWSPVGVATEYLKPCVAVRNSEKVLLPALSEKETIVVDGMILEDNLTSGGAADLPDALAGKVKTLDYKTLRFVGHYDWVDNVLNITPEGKDRVKRLQDTMQEFIPSVEDDQVIIYASVQGKDDKGVLRAMEGSYRILPMKVGTKTLRAIQSTTAAPLAECARMLCTGKWKGVVFQSQLNPESFMNGPFVSKVYG